MSFIATSLTLVSATPAHADPACQNNGFYVLWARGSGQPFWHQEDQEPAEARRFHNDIFYALDTAGLGQNKAWAELGNLDGNYSNPPGPTEYPAVPVSDWNAVNVVTGYYADSVTIGANELVTHLNDRYAGDGPTGSGTCDTETAIIGGLSQGADVVGTVLNRVDLAPAAKGHIGYVALYGDPRMYAQICPADPWVRGNAGCGYGGVLPDRNPYLPFDLHYRVGSWCDQGDGICKLGQPIIGGTHETAYRNWWIWQSAAQVVQGAINSRPGVWQGVGGATHRGDGMASDYTIYRNQYLASANVQHALVFQNDGNLVLYHNGQVTWQTATNGQGGTKLRMQTDGNLVMYRNDDSVVWFSGTGGHPGAYANLQSDGNFVIRNATTAFWQSQSGGHPNLSYFGSDRLNAGQQLIHNQYLRSSNGQYALLMQSDGNAVLYGPGYHVLWQSITSGSGDRLTMQTDGNLVLYAINTPRWWTNTSGANVRAVMQSDGNFVVYNSSNYPLWYSGTGGQI